MSVVTIRVGGRDYRVACGEGEEDRLRLLAEELDDRIQSLTYGMKTKPNEAMSLLLAGLMLVDELAEKSKKIELLEAETALPPSHDFKEMEEALASTMHEIAERIERISYKLEA